MGSNDPEMRLPADAKCALTLVYTPPSQELFAASCCSRADVDLYLPSQRIGTSTALTLRGVRRVWQVFNALKRMQDPHDPGTENQFLCNGRIMMGPSSKAWQPVVTAQIVAVPVVVFIAFEYVSTVLWPVLSGCIRTARRALHCAVLS